MKSTGVVRRIDELGRVVIPKEIRRNLLIRDGENLEIFIEDNNIILKKISKIVDFSDYASVICDQFWETLNLEVAISDREKIVVANGNILAKIINHQMENVLTNLIDNREYYISESLTNFKFNQELVSGYFSIHPIITSTDCLGLAIFYSESPLDKHFKKISKLLASLISKNIDVG